MFQVRLRGVLKIDPTRKGGVPLAFGVVLCEDIVENPSGPNVTNDKCLEDGKEKTGTFPNVTFLELKKKIEINTKNLNDFIHYRPARANILMNDLSSCSKLLEPANAESSECNSHTDEALEEKLEICKYCPKKFVCVSDLQLHHTKCHPDKFRFKEKNFQCDVCQKYFTNKRGVLEHKKKMHNIDISRKSNVEKKYKCDVCSQLFGRNYNLKKHKKAVHKVEIPSREGFKCSECESSFSSKTYFLDHLVAKHELPVSVETMEFETREEFESWKYEVEKKTLSFYSREKKYTTIHGLETVSYVCHRSGHFESKGAGKRRIKKGGSNKIGSFCPASIFVQSTSVGKSFPAKIKFIAFHVGHRCEAEKLLLSKPEKEQIARQLLSGVPRSQALSKILENASPSTRLATTNLQDIRNISKQYKVDSHAICFQNDVDSINSWAEQMSNSDSNPIVLYKLAGDENYLYPVLGKGFMLEEQNKEKKLSDFQQETKNIVLGFLSKLEVFKSKDQCTEINKTIARLTSKCEAIGKQKARKSTSKG